MVDSFLTTFTLNVLVTLMTCMSLPHHELWSHLSSLCFTMSFSFGWWIPSWRCSTSGSFQCAEFLVSQFIYQNLKRLLSLSCRSHPKFFTWLDLAQSRTSCLLICLVRSADSFLTIFTLTDLVTLITGMSSPHHDSNLISHYSAS